MKRAIRIFLALFFLCLPTLVGEDNKEKADWGAIFRMHWQNRVKLFREQNQGWQNVVLLGDSITEGFDTAKYFPGYRILNRGIGGDVIGNEMGEGDPRGVLQRLDSSVFDCAATNLFILIGINDLNTGRDVAQMERGYRELLAQIRKHSPKLSIHVQSILPTGGARRQMNPSILEFNGSLRKMAKEFNCQYLDLHSLMKDGQGNLKAEFTEDGLHLKHEAYLVWRKVILDTLGWGTVEP